MAASTALIEARAAAIASRESAEKAAARVDQVLPWVARSLEGLCRLAGEHALADRVRAR